MREWSKAIAGALTLIGVGVSLAGVTNLFVGLTVAGIGVAWCVYLFLRRGETDAPAVAPSFEIAERLRCTGSGEAFLNFGFGVANYGAQSCRATVEARVGSQSVEVRPQTLELMANTSSQSVTVVVPRPKLGNLIPQFNDEPTLYGEVLTIEVHADRGNAHAEDTWQERIYTPEENSARTEIQQREWRFGKGEQTEADEIAVQQAELLGRNPHQHD
jgi:hypothetical protein